MFEEGSVGRKRQQALSSFHGLVVWFLGEQVADCGDTAQPLSRLGINSADQVEGFSNMSVDVDVE